MSNTLMTAFDMVESRIFTEDENVSYIDDVDAAEKLSGYNLESLRELLHVLYGRTVNLRKTCLFDNERRDIMRTILAFVKEFDKKLGN